MKHFIYSCLVSKRKVLVYFSFLLIPFYFAWSFSNTTGMFPRYSVENLNIDFVKIPDEYSYLNQKAGLYLHKRGNISFFLKYKKTAGRDSEIFNQDNINFKYFILTRDDGFDISQIRYSSPHSTENVFPWKEFDLRWHGETSKGMMLDNKFTGYLDLDTALAESPYLSTRNLLVISIEGLNNARPLLFAAPINMLRNMTDTIELVEEEEREDILNILNKKVSKKNLEYYEKSIFNFTKDYKNFWKKIGHQTYELTNSYFNNLALGVTTNDFANYHSLPAYDVYKKLCILFYPYGEKKSICEGNPTSIIDISRFDLIYKIYNNSDKKFPKINPTINSGVLSNASGKTVETNHSIINLTSFYANLTGGLTGQVGVAGPANSSNLGGSASLSGGVGLSYNYLDNDLNYQTEYENTEILRKSEIEYNEIKANFNADVVSCFAIRSIPYTKTGRMVVTASTAPTMYRGNDINLDTKIVYLFCLPKKLNTMVSEKYFYLKEKRSPTDDQLWGSNMSNMGTIAAFRGPGIFNKYLEIARFRTVKWKTNVTAADYAQELSNLLGLGQGNEFYKFYHYPGVLKRY
ncbi:MAG: hypothetical protein QE271_13925 [Bacteriovoracaceae bacterium]|nr:hypothetical protein [Bacteriovoracaceae bacterium]